ncbi:MAG TPA: hypothetical protein VEK56_00480 [Vicinamibacterales bacterium]|nr:hypothetical protein [Vicinamibacterales bacterium]
MTPTELQQLLRDFYLERLALLMRHEASARLVTDYDVNNAYQYIINREETHVSWLQHALIDLGAEIPDDPPPPTIKRSRKDKNAVIELSADDGKGNREFVQKWRDRIEHVTNARHQGMLRVILGEMLEHQRLFEQAAEGRTDLTGKPMEIHTRRGKVLATRWIE